MTKTYIRIVIKTLASIAFLFAFIMLFTILLQNAEQINGEIYATPLALTLSALLMYRLFEKNSSWDFRLKDPLWSRNLLMGSLVAALFVGISVLLMVIAGNIEIQKNNVSGQILLSQIALFSLVAVGEELFFRGYLYGLYEKAYSPKFAVIMSSILFAAIHLINPDAFSRPPVFIALEMINIFMIALLFGISRYSSNSLWFPIFLHLFINVIQTTILGFVNGGKQMPSLLSLENTKNTLINGSGYGFESSLAATIVLLAILMIFIVFGLRRKDEPTLELS
ncbi:CPBP family intramembrane glutamic endopeptidase [Fictibacillus fluitans]|uniref:Type II CAAX endopeptidase family protein n=1 Tax=Fictibacillus fluitans TaxID=3058422 RepID=A0ABT8HUW9_9BACL|nr:type II CAAX endopeptidase family protein [Fictibacillus sp. NE201]MDN4524057.1 type II CAAX endopeptidase family protein [Fictibacillus sp. NE201]